MKYLLYKLKLNSSLYLTEFSVIIKVNNYIFSKNTFNLFLSPLSDQQIDRVILDNNEYYPLGTVMLIGSTLFLLLCAICMNQKRECNMKQLFQFEFKKSSRKNNMDCNTNFYFFISSLYFLNYSIVEDIQL